VCNGKRYQNIFIGLKKMTCLGVLEYSKKRNKDNATGLKDEGGIEMSIYSASIHYNDNYNLL
jgi:hypothetical protein